MYFACNYVYFVIFIRMDFVIDNSYRSQDRSIAVWDMTSQTEIALRRVLVGHRAAVNVVDFDEKYIVSASGDRTIKVWNTSNCEFVRTLNGHKRGIACLQYRDRLVVSGSSDNTIRLWDIECGACLRVLEGHEELVRCIRFDSKHIVSGAYDGYVCVFTYVKIRMSYIILILILRLQRKIVNFQRIENLFLCVIIFLYNLFTPN